MDSEPNFKELGAEGYNTHTIMTPEGEKECVSAAYSDTYPDKLRFLLREKTLELECLCSYPNSESFDALPHEYLHVGYINIPPKLAPSKIANFHTIPGAFKNGPDFSGINLSEAQKLYESLKKIEKQYRPICEDQNLLLEESSDLLGKIKSYTPLSDFKKITDTFLQQQKFEASMHLEKIFRHFANFDVWANKYTFNDLAGMLSLFPSPLHPRKPTKKTEKIYKEDRRRMFWLWQACFSKMQQDKQQIFRDDKGRPRRNPECKIEEIESVVCFPDGSKVYCGPVEKREHTEEEKYRIAAYYKANEEKEMQKALLQKKEDENRLLNYEELAARLNISKRTLMNYKKRCIISHIPVGDNVRFDWKEVLRDLRKYNFTPTED